MSASNKHAKKERKYEGRGKKKKKKQVLTFSGAISTITYLPRMAKFSRQIYEKRFLSWHTGWLKAGNKKL